MKTPIFRMFIVGPALIATACSGNPQAQTPKPAPTAIVQGAVKEADLATITLTPEAEGKLQIQLEEAAIRQVPSYRTVSGEVTLPPGQSRTVTAPLAGTLTAVNGIPAIGASVRKGQPLFRLVPFERESRGRDLRADAQKELDSAHARVEAAQARSRRAAELLQGGGGSQRNVEEAQLELAQALAAERAAGEQLTYLSTTPFDTGEGLLIEAPDDGLVLKTFATGGQTVPAGAPLAEIARVTPLWIRVPVYVGELSALAGSRSVVVHGIGGTPGSGGRSVRRIQGVPSANAAAATSDLFYELENPSGTYKIGERVGVSFATSQSENLAVPWSAIIHDVNGGTWVYESTAPQTYSRRRVEVLFVRDGVAALRRGPAPGTKVVKTGAAELFGTEFGVGK